MTHFLTAVHTWPYHRLVEGSSNYKWNVGDRNNNWQTALGRVFFDKGYQRSPPYHLGLRTQEGLLRPWTHWINNNKSLGQLMIININYYAAHQSFSNLLLLLLNHMRGASYRNSLEFFGEWTKKMQMSWLAWYQDLRAKRGMNRVKITRVCISFTLSTWSCNWGMFSYPFGCPAPTIHAASHSFLVWLSIVPSVVRRMPFKSGGEGIWSSASTSSSATYGCQMLPQFGTKNSLCLTRLPPRCFYRTLQVLNGQEWSGGGVFSHRLFGINYTPFIGIAREMS